MDYLIDILMPVYNHEKYIKFAIEGVLMQITNFKFRLIIGEDCSTDNSKTLIKKYETTYPDVIFTLYHEKNLGAAKNNVIMYSFVTAKYIAICEGDDYWTDPYKLQKQVDFLEKNDDFTICFTNVEIVDTNNELLPESFAEITKDVFSIEDIIFTSKVFIPTATIIFRNVLPNPLPEFKEKALSGDIALHLMLTDIGKAKYLPIKTAVYRKHQGGITNSLEHKTKGDDNLFHLYEDANAYFNYKYDEIFRKRLLELAKIKLVYGSRNLKGVGKLKYVIKNCKKYFYYSEKINLKEIFYYFILLFIPNLLKLKKHF